MAQTRDDLSKRFVEEIADQDDDFDRWYVDVVKRAELADDAPVRVAITRAVRRKCEDHRLRRLEQRPVYGRPQNIHRESRTVPHRYVNGFAKRPCRRWQLLLLDGPALVGAQPAVGAREVPACVVAPLQLPIEPARADARPNAAVGLRERTAVADGQRAEEHGHVVDPRDVVDRILMSNIGRSAGQIEHGTVQARELRLVDLYPAAAAARVLEPPRQAGERRCQQHGQDHADSVAGARGTMRLVPEMVDDGAVYFGPCPEPGRLQAALRVVRRLYLRPAELLAGGSPPDDAPPELASELIELLRAHGDRFEMRVRGATADAIEALDFERAARLNRALAVLQALREVRGGTSGGVLPTVLARIEVDFTTFEPRLMRRARRSKNVTSATDGGGPMVRSSG